MFTAVGANKGERISDDEMIRVRGRDYSAHAVCVEVEQKEALMLSLFDRLPLLSQAERHRATQLRHLRKDMETMHKAGKSISRRQFKAALRRVRAAENESLAMSRSIENHERNVKSFATDLHGLVVFVRAMLSSRERDVSVQ